jgi:hypothetical protein
VNLNPQYCRKQAEKVRLVSCHSDCHLADLFGYAAKFTAVDIDGDGIK